MVSDQPQWTADQPFSAIRPAWRVNAPLLPEDGALTAHFAAFGILGLTPVAARDRLLYDGLDPENFVRESMVARGVTPMEHRNMDVNVVRLRRMVLTADDVRTLRQRYLHGESGPALARAYGLANSTVYKALHGEHPYDRLIAAPATGGAR